MGKNLAVNHAFFFLNTTSAPLPQQQTPQLLFSLKKAVDNRTKILNLNSKIELINLRLV